MALTLFTEKYGRKGWAFQVTLATLILLALAAMLNPQAKDVIFKVMESVLYLYGTFVLGNSFEHFTKKGKAAQGANGGEQPNV